MRTTLMLAKMLLEDDRADDFWLYEALRALVDRALMSNEEAVRGRLAVVPLVDQVGWFEVRARFGSGAQSWVTLFRMDELDFTFERFVDALPGAVAGT